MHKFVTLKADADARIAKLVHNTFSKVALVTSYALAMDVARDYHLTCITPDLQLVHAGAFITQVGHYNRSQLDRATLYRRVSQIEHQVEDKVLAGMQFERVKEQQADRELDALRKLQKAEVTMNALKSAYQQLTSMLFEFKSQIDHKQTHLQELERQIEDYTAREKEFQSQIKQLEASA